MERTGKSPHKLNVMGRDASALALRSFLVFLQGLFKSGIFGYRYSEDDNQTDIIIQEADIDGGVDPEALPKLPALCVYEGPGQWGNMNSATLDHAGFTSGTSQHKMPQAFSLVVKVISKDRDEVKDLTSTIFTMLPIFPSLIGKKTGIAFPSSPLKTYATAPSKNAFYPMGVITVPCSVMVALEVSREKGSFFDTLLHDVTMALETELPEPTTPRSRRFILGNTPKDMIDVVVLKQPSYNGTPVVEDPCEDETAGQGTLTQSTKLSEG